MCAPEEIAYRNNWISPAELKELAEKLSKTPYSRRLLDNLRD